MFTRVNAFLEAIDKKTEEMAAAAEEEDIARAIQQQQSRSNASVVSHATNVHSRSSTTTTGTASVMDNDVGFGGVAASPPLRSTSAPFMSSLKPQSATANAAAVVAATTSMTPPSSSAAAIDNYAAVHPMPLALPTELPSLRLSLVNVDDNAKRFEVGLCSTAAGASGGDTSDMATAHMHLPSLSGPSPSTLSLSSVFGQENISGAIEAARSASVAALERLQSRCATLEADKLRWQQEAATHKAQCSAARDALWKAEQEARSSRTAQREAERALAAYKETSQRLLEEAEQKVQRAQNGNSLHGQRNGTTASSSLPATEQREEVAQTRELHQRLELLQAEHSILLNEVDRLHEEAAKAATELQRMQNTCRQAQSQVDELQLELQTAQESLEGEMAAHKDTKKTLRDLQAQRDQQQHQQQERQMRQNGKVGVPGDMVDGQGSGDESTKCVEVAQLQRELREAKQRQQLLELQLSNKAAALNSAERESADLKTRYNELARQFDDVQVEVAAGFRVLDLAPNEYSSVETSGGRYHRVRNTYAANENSVVNSAHDKYVPSSLNHAKNSNGAVAGEVLKRHPAMVRLARQYGVVGRVAVSALAAVDAAAFRLGHALTQSRWLWRIILMGYISLLQLWVVLLVLVSMAHEETRYTLVYMTSPAPMPQ